MFLSVLAFFLGIFSLQQASELPSVYFLLFLASTALLLALLNYWRWVFFLLGFLYASIIAQSYLDNQLSEYLQGQEILIQGNIIGLPKANKQRVSFGFKVTQSPVSLPNKIRLSWYYPKQKISAGQSWQFFVKLKQPHGSLNPGGFDYEKWLFSQHIGATGYIRQTQQAKLLATQPAWSSLAVIRQSLLHLLDQQVISKDSLALIKALTLGDKSTISPAQWQVLANTGSSHLMSISGLHIGLIAGFVYLLVFRSYLYIRSNQFSAPQVAALFSLLAALLYAALAGFSIPTQRALVMLSVLMLTLLFRRHILVLNIFAIALFLVLVIDPLAILSAGFYLSFFAVFFIVYSFSGRLAAQNKWLNRCKIHFIVALGLLPVLLFFFQSVPLISPLANLIAVPVVSFMVVPLALLAVTLLGVMPDLASFLLQGVDSVLQYLWDFLSLLAELPSATIVRPKPDGWQVLLGLLGILLLLAPKGIPARYLGSFLLLPLFFIVPEKPAMGDAKITVLDVGQGLAVVVQTAEHQLVFDTGAKFSEKFDMGKNVLVPFLQQQSIQYLDKLIISHADNDHIGGTASLLKRIPSQQVMSSVPEQLTQYQAVACQQGDAWYWDGVAFELLSPPKQGFGNENDNSCVLKITTQQGSVLLTGDIEAKAEYYLSIEQKNKLAADVLVAPHHGSKTSSTGLFLQHVSPDFIVIPAAAPNRFGFPHKEVIARYQQLGAHYFVTGKSGAVNISFVQGKAQLQSYREQYRHYWNR